jgi:hypothetical protein
MSTTKIVKRKVTGFFKPKDVKTIGQVVQINHKIYVRASMLVRAFFLQDSKNVIVEDHVFQMACNISCNKVYKARDEQKQQLVNSMKELYNQLYGDDFIDDNKLSLSHLQGYGNRNLLTAYKNNVFEKFLTYPKRYLLCHLLQIGLTEKEARKESFRIAFGIFTFGNNKIKNVQKVSEQEVENYSFLFPNKLDNSKSYCDDIEIQPWEYLKKMIEINKYIETWFTDVEPKFRKLLNPLPFHSSNVPMHIRFDKAGLSQLLIDDVEDFRNFLQIHFPKDNVTMKSKASLNSSFEKIIGRPPIDDQEEKYFGKLYWLFITNLEDCRQYKEIQNLEGWEFDNSILTDGVSLSLQIAKTDKVKKKKGAISTKKVHKKKQKEDKNIKIIKPSTKIVSCDPGKHDIVYLTDGVKTLRYTKGRRATDTLSKPRTRETNASRKRCGVDVFETDVLSQHCKKSCIFETFIQYVKARHKEEKKLEQCYEHPKFRQFKFLQYCKVKSSEDKFAKQIFDTFASSNTVTKTCCNETMKQNKEREATTKQDIVIGWGNWGRDPNKIKGVCPTPGIGFRRSMERYYKTVTVDERNTSKTCPCCREVSLYNPKIGKDNKEKHHLLRCKNDKCCSRWWNRNVAGSYNILQNTMKDLELL